jgi:hypothetical protein
VASRTLADHLDWQGSTLVGGASFCRDVMYCDRDRERAGMVRS